MGSSKGGGGNPNIPSGMPVGPMGGAPPPGIAPPYNPGFVSFLPSDPNASATGLTQSMLDQINRPAPPPPPARGAASMPPDLMRAMIADMIAKQMPARPSQQMFGPYTGANGLMGYNYRGGANRSGGGGFGGGYGASGGGGYSTSARGGSSSSAGYGGGMGGRKR
jgi:hypothetical protein